MGEGVLFAALGGLISAIVVVIIAMLINILKKYVFLIGAKSEKANLEGKLAYQNQICINDNPYPESDKARHIAWRKGWYTAEGARKKFMK